jgi:predicted metal-dependent hydrolase
MRNDEWLEKRLEKIWQILIPDVERLNQVSICFRGKWKTKFGDIKKLKDGSTRVRVNGLFKHEEIPEYIIDTTIAHELIHYMHGFSSPHQKQFNHPHKGGVVNKELKKRGFGLMLNLEKKWVKENWEKIILPLKENAYISYSSDSSIRPFYP